MSWLLGSRFNQQQQPQNFSQLINPPPASGGGGDDDGPKDGKNQRSSMEYRFDSSALERAAAAAKELEKSGKILSVQFSYISTLIILQIQSAIFSKY